MLAWVATRKGKAAPPVRPL